MEGRPWPARAGHRVDAGNGWNALRISLPAEHDRSAATGYGELTPHNLYRCPRSRASSTKTCRMLSYCLTPAEEVGTLPDVILAQAILTGRRIND